MNGKLCLLQLAHFFPFGISQTIGGNVGSSPQLIPVSPRQRKLLGVAENDPLFGTSTPKQDPKPSDKASHPFGFPPPLEGSFVASSTPARANIHQVWSTTVQARFVLFSSLHPFSFKCEPIFYHHIEKCGM